MYMREIDWNDPKFARWHLGNLSPLTNAQREAVWEDDEIDDPPITKEDKIEICTKFDCKVEFFHSNVCYGVEKHWPKKYFGVDDFKGLPERKQKQLHNTMIRHGVELYNKYVDPERTKKRMKRKKAKALAPFWEERRLRYRFERIKKIGENDIIQVNDLIDQNNSVQNVNMTGENDSPRPANQKRKPGPRSKTVGPQIKKSKQSADTSHNVIDTDLENFATPNRRITRSAQASTSNQREVSSMTITTTPNRRSTRSTHIISNSKKNEIEPENVFTESTRARQSTNVTPNRLLTRSATKNSAINTNVTVRRPQNINRQNDTSNGGASNSLSPRSPQISEANVPADNQQSPREDVNTKQIVTTPTRRNNRLRQNISSDAETTPARSKRGSSDHQRTFCSFSPNAVNRTVVYTQSQQSNQITKGGNPSFSVDSPDTASMRSDFESLSENVHDAPTTYRQSSDNNVTNRTPVLIVDESHSETFINFRTKRSDTNATEEINSEDFREIDENLTSTQK